MTWSKRLLDLAVAIPACLIALPILLVLCLLLLIREGRPIFYISERMKTPTEGFGLVKLRTMRPSPPGTEAGVTGGDKSDRMSDFHRLLRRTRADELPQLWNVLKGDMSLVGPRPPLRVYVEDYPELYGEVLQCRPGVTGIASLRFHRREEQLLAACRSAAETDAVYRRRCVPRKAHMDILYRNSQSVCGDISLIIQTIARLFGRH
ncbi:sugar transferase [Flavimaricola marinus]|uniref:Putative undecaprenyl-phosphate N-acetylgalactosaminyl 1-phosphate transferase n=1 Tax=Flavimaricola marinus TaxID=1819565 RepID=A0A238LAE5_9RHOB|nr:sugar transferase [Flavimaricola marinus]SMY06533.1 Putative undecaprenyl-phosphate N-acetylgalactosaminyl 1-phosphate transferase [Flavimaricola marinus]